MERGCNRSWKYADWLKGNRKQKLRIMFRPPGGRRFPVRILFSYDTDLEDDILDLVDI